MKPLKPYLAYLTILLAAVLTQGGTEPADALSVAPRTSFRLHLAKINIAYDETTKKYDRVKIYFDETDAHSIIARSDDMQVKKGGETTVYRETPGREYMLSDFEAKTISQVCRTLIVTLEELENILKNKDWGKALYLDSFFPRFLQGFHVMICAAKDSPEALPRSALVREEDFDVSLNSPKSDARITMWQTEKDRIMKLRISAQELTIQTKKWQKDELNNPKRNPELSYSGEFDRAFTSFVRNYFGYVP